MGRRATAGPSWPVAPGRGSGESSPAAFHQALKDEPDFPLARGTSPVDDYRTWRRIARAKVAEHLLVGRQEGTPYAPEFGDSSQGGCFTRESVTISLTRDDRVRAALLPPNGTGPFPGRARPAPEGLFWFPPDAASIAAPRPMLFRNGGLGPLFPADGVRTAHEKLRAVRRSRHTEERLHLRTWPDLGHVFVDRMQDEVFSRLVIVL
ncbi:MAG: hypothetical protein HOY79_19050 [Streptomyces sp.]|nr:hypothetical protein [Streptomyces sp.]